MEQNNLTPEAAPQPVTKQTVSTPTPTTPASEVNTETTPAPKKSDRKIFLIVILAVVALMLAGIIAAYFLTDMGKKGVEEAEIAMPEPEIVVEEPTVEVKTEIIDDTTPDLTEEADLIKELETLEGLDIDSLDGDLTEGLTELDL